MGSLLKNKTTATVFAAIFALGASFCLAQDVKKPDADKKSSIYATYPATTPTGNPEQESLIKRGEYLAKMGDCIACHTNAKEGTPAYAGGLPLATPFGTFYSPNITPDKKTGIGNWTEADFIQAVKKGKGPNGQNYFPVFPYVYFANMTDDDAHALYVYFMNVPAVEMKNKPLPFPFSIPGSRTTLLGWNLLFFYPNSLYEYDAKQTPAWNRGKYIVDGLGHCSMCHTPLNPLGSPKMSYYLTGGFIEGYWAPNITKAGLESVTHADVAEVFSKNELLNNAGPVRGPMAEANHDSLQHLTADDHLAISEYLKTVVSVDPNGLPASENPPTLSRGKQVYISACILCHQNGEMSAPIIGNSPSWYRRLKDNGLTGLYRHVINGYNSMPIKGACVTCSDNDIKASVDYILDKSLSRSQILNITSGETKKTPVTGQEIYNEHCSVCHSDAKSGAPLIGDKKVWQPLINQNMDLLVEHAKDKNHLQGHCKDCSTGELMKAIKYIVSQSKTEGNFSLW